MEQITLTDLNDTLLLGFVREHPIRQLPVLDDKGNPTFDKDEKEITKPECTPVQAIRRFVIARIAKEALAGLDKMTLENNPTNKNLIETVINSNQD